MGEFKEVNREGNWLLCSNDLISFELYHKSQLIATFFRDWEYLHMPNFKVLNDLYIELSYFYSLKYVIPSSRLIGYFDFKGNKIDKNIINALQESKQLESINKKESINDVITISDTFWSVQKDGLFFGIKLIYNIELNDLSDFCVSEFNSGFAFVKIFADCDPEFGTCYYDSIGYIDVYGNNYWNFDDNLDS